MSYSNTSETQVTTLIDQFFTKEAIPSSHTTLANYENGTLVAGGQQGQYYTHICYHTIQRALLELARSEAQSPYVFVETGCAAHGTKSTLLWDRFVGKFGGKVLSVDLNNEAVSQTNTLTSDRTHVECSDSLNYLPTLQEPIDFLYLDSYDVDFMNPLPSAEHHLKEFNCIKHLLRKGSIVLIDDTPISPEWLDNGTQNAIYPYLRPQFNVNMSGKGSLVNRALEEMGAHRIMHQYQVLWKIV